ncbi:hypothetical protein KAFR_0L00370 [Kazachstania africana CBS 2517]|uniref:Kinesin-like protein n=1 Tax=Kazachstania africana (strain ATCC 22294 / BCRC 22015 / CBS 2517 / CECT 1963 / NBRC 1671 / NRRL Y-8276) TaxID=1071382 RepID=H2B1Z4_KAZAF|nr:hypothetical protein KAFR_0L00370 [Kazachstania africana CBS 2517]CCF60644.1 hypothetical protein KAFR_0L00370 [Kazachstania africana CBS 2517]
MSDPTVSSDKQPQEEELNITVAVRCRGRNQREIDAKSSVVVTVPDIMGSKEVAINTSEDIGFTAQMNSKTYTVDKVFGPSATQSLIFDEIAEPLFSDFIKGYNCTMLVYGMTSTGKTYTMTGDEKLYNEELSDSAGIIPRILFKLFETLEKLNEDHIVKCSFVELYNEELKDLLHGDCNNDNGNFKKLRIFDSLGRDSRSNSRNNSPKMSNNNTTFLKKKLRNEALLRSRNIASSKRSSMQTIRNTTTTKASATTTTTTMFSSGNNDSANKFSPADNDKSTIQSDQTAGIYIQNLQEFHITTAKEGIKLLQKGLKYRQVASTKMNDFSSRSHTIFTITLFKEVKGEIFRLSKMNLVDLAGSENINRSGALNQRAKEAGSINQSLLTLGRVINSLADKNVHVPFRESKLTRLLQDSLGGNTKTALIATISPAKVTLEETCSTLEYASKAKNIKNKPQLGSFIMKDILLKNITTELTKIKSDLLSTKSKDGIYMDQQHYKELTTDLQNYKTEIQECKRTIESLTSQNALLLKDKRTINENNELQRIKIQTMNESMKKLYAKIERQQSIENELDGKIQIFTKTNSKLTKIIDEMKNREALVNSKFKTLLDHSLSYVSKKLNYQIENFKDQGINQNFTVDENLQLIKSEMTNLLSTARDNFEKFYQECITKFLSDTPLLFDEINDNVLNLKALTSNYYSQIAENLSDLSEEYNNFKQFITDEFYNQEKGHQHELLNKYINNTQTVIESSSNDVMSTIQNLLNEHLRANKELIINSLSNVTTELMSNELDRLKPKLSKWEESAELINRSDALNNEFNDNVESSMTTMTDKIKQTNDSINNNIKKINEHFKTNDIAHSNNLMIDDNNIIKNNFKSIEEKNSRLHEFVKEGYLVTNESMKKLNELDTSIRTVLKDIDYEKDIKETNSPLKPSHKHDYNHTIPLDNDKKRSFLNNANDNEMQNQSKIPRLE